MRGTFTIFWKDLKGMLTSPTFYVVTFLCTVILSYLFPINFYRFIQMSAQAMFQRGMMSQQLNIHYSLYIMHISYLNLILLFIIPALTMKLLAEEKKLHTFDLLLTSPVSSWQIVVGKYFAGYAVVCILILISFLYPLATVFFITSKVPWALLISSYIGLLLLGAQYTAMGMFCSSLSSSVFVSYVMGVILNISVWFVGAGVELVDSPAWRDVFEHISLNTHLSGMVQGAVRTGGLIFFLSVIVLFVFLAERVVESSRWR